MWKYFGFTTLLALVGIGAGFFIDGWAGIYLITILALLEVSLSFDNAVVNAKILADMDKIWQRRFLTWGIIIAVFGMRFLFPILIVAIVAHWGVVETIKIALYHPEQYHQALLHSEKMIYAFGGAFLWMVFSDFLIGEKHIRWIKPVERYAEKLGSIKSSSLMVAMLIGIIITYYSKSYQIAIAYFLGILSYSILHSLNHYFSTLSVKNGLMGLIYLEVLDASFSFDGVIGAFAITSNIFIIMLGLGIGALYVRSLTIWMVEEGVLEEFPYLEHGAHYAIGTLATIMLLKIFFEIGEMVTGTLGLLLLGIAFIHSYIVTHRRKRARLQQGKGGKE
ncbi:MAG: hypothetical protein C6I01_04405 [Epsilonproteobacteria bacterium]|nr:hypothetical protein [Campylobacterota bacterium]NPA89431.1 DUF475 domain-containing protein [Campylobacterota bacterium]